MVLETFNMDSAELNTIWKNRLKIQAAIVPSHPNTANFKWIPAGGSEYKPQILNL